MICPFCKETILDGAIKCRHCGSMLSNANPVFGTSSDSITVDEIREFAGANPEYYIQQFSKFTRSGTEEFCPTWNWSCFGLTFLWMLYRKMYLQSLITFVVFCIPGINLLMHIVVGIVGNYLYYRHAREKILEIRAVPSPLDRNPVFQEAGGVNKWMITVGAIFAIIMTILFAVFFSTMIALMGQHVTRITI